MPINLPKGFENMKNLDSAKIINVSASSESLDFLDGLTLLFIGLKLTGHLDTWTWVEVLAPLWAPFMLSWFIRLINATFFASDDEEEE